MLGNTEDEGDLGIIGQDSELFVTLQESDLTWLKSVSEAVERIDNGNYGECVSCRQDIDEETLAALPWVAFCLRCARYQVGTRPYGWLARSNIFDERSECL